MANVGKLQDEAIKRKERLQSLRRGRQCTNGEPPAKKHAEAEGESEESLPRPVFRSYQPHDKTLQDAQLDRMKPPEVAEHITEQLKAAEPVPLVEEVDLVNLAPRKPDWDLKRDVARKLERVEKRTQRAIAELIRERLKAEGDENLADAVDANVAAGAADVADD